MNEPRCAYDTTKAGTNAPYFERPVVVDVEFWWTVVLLRQSRSRSRCVGSSVGGGSLATNAPASECREHDCNAEMCVSMSDTKRKLSYLYTAPARPREEHEYPRHNSVMV